MFSVSADDIIIYPTAQVTNLGIVLVSFSLSPPYIIHQETMLTLSQVSTSYTATSASLVQTIISLLKLL